MSKSNACLDAFGVRTLDICRYCNSTCVPSHKHITYKCVECGKLHSRWLKARTESEMCRCGAALLARRYKDMPASVETYYKKVEERIMTVNSNKATTKVCKQCGRTLALDEFRKYAPRGKGIYSTTQSEHTVCKACESAAAALARILNKSPESYSHSDKEFLAYVNELLALDTFTPTLASFKRFVGMRVERAPASGAAAKRLAALVADVKAVGEVTGETAVSETDSSDEDMRAAREHLLKVKERLYRSVDEADEAHKRLVDVLQRTGLYEEATNQLDDWFMED